MCVQMNAHNYFGAPFTPFNLPRDSISPIVLSIISSLTAFTFSYWSNLHSNSKLEMLTFFAFNFNKQMKFPTNVGTSPRRLPSLKRLKSLPRGPWRSTYDLDGFFPTWRRTLPPSAVFFLVFIITTTIFFMSD